MGFFRNIATALLRSLSPNLSAFLTGEDVRTGGGAEMLNGYEQSTWVYSAVNALATNVSQIPFRISQGEANDENIIAKGPVVDLFKKPHDFLDRFLFWELLVTWLMIRGEAFVVALDKQDRVIAVRDARGRNMIAKLLILSPDRFWHIIDGGTLQGWRYTGMNYNDPPMESQIFLPEEVMQLRLPNPFLFWRGMSPMSVALLAAKTDYASAQFMKGLMLNNADTGVVVTTDQQASAEQREEIIAALKARKRQAGTADRPLFLWGGAKVEKPTVSSADMQFLENRKLNRLEIGAVFGVPSTVMGFSEDANRAVAGTERLQFIEQRIIPLCIRVESFIEPVVQSFDKRNRGFFHTESLPIMQEARRNRGTAAKSYFDIGVPLNDINKIFNLGLPAYPWGDTGYLPFNVQPAGTTTPNDPTDTEEDGDETEQGDNEKAVKQLDGMLAILKNANSTPKQLPVPHVCTSSGEYEASIAGAVKALAGKMSKLFFEQRGRVLGKMDKLDKSVLTAETKSIDDLFDKSSEDQAILGKVNPTLLADLEFGGAQLFQELNLGDFNLPPNDAIAYLKKRENKLTDVNQTTFDALKSSLEEGLQEGETYDQLVARVKQVFQDASDNRAETIALTETNSAVNTGRMGAMVQAKVEKKGWATSKLDNVRPTHQRAGSDYATGIPIDQPFRVGGYDLMHPGDPDGPPQEVINCRCFAFAIVGGKSFTSPALRWESFQARRAPERVPKPQNAS